MKQTNNQWIKDALLYGAIFIVLLFTVSFLPVVGIFLLVVLPVPLSIFTYKHGYKKGLVLGGLILVSTLIFAFNFFFLSLPLTLLAILSGGAVGESVRRGRHPYETLVHGTAFYMIGFMILMAALEFVMGIHLATEYRLLIQDSLLQSQQMMETVGVTLSESELAAVKEQMLVVLDVIPALMLITSAVMSLILQWLTFKLLNRLEKRKLFFPAIRRFNLPKSIIWLFLVVLLLSLISYPEGSMFANILMNVSLLIGLLFSMQGLSFIFYYLHKKRQPKTLAIVLTVIAIIILPVGLYVTRILGIIDIGFMMRKRLK